MDATVSLSPPPSALLTVVTVISVSPSIAPVAENSAAPFANVLFVATKDSKTIFPSDNALLTIPSPK